MVVLSGFYQQVQVSPILTHGKIAIPGALKLSAIMRLTWLIKWGGEMTYIASRQKSFKVDK